MEKKFNSLNYYGYVENTSFAPKKTEIAISQDDNIISVTDDGALLGTVKLDIDNETLSLIGKDGEIFSSVSLPAAAMKASIILPTEHLLRVSVITKTMYS